MTNNEINDWVDVAPAKDAGADDWVDVKAAPHEDHSLWGAVKSAGRGALDAVNALGTRPITDIAYDHLVKPGVDAYNQRMDEYSRDPNAPDGLDQMAVAGARGAAAGLDAVTRTGRNMLMPATVPVDVGLDSYQRGNSVGDALHDAANAGMIVGAPAAAGAAARGLTGPVGQALAKDAVSLLPSKVTALGSGETAQLLRGKAADAFDTFQAAQAPSATPDPTSIHTRDIFSGGGKPSMGAGAMGAALVKAAYQKGPQQGAIAHYLTSQRDPAYAASLQKKEDK